MTAKRLPPLTTLQAFELAARLGSFTRAAERLGVSQSAVTRQVALLEENIGVKLFHRGRRGVALTPEGDLFREEISPAFERLEVATARLRDHSAEDLLRLRVYPTFALQWLIPRLRGFQAWAPRIRLAIDTDVAPVDFERNPLDAAIQFGPDTRADVDTEPLMPDEIEPICSPALLAGREDEVELSDLERMPILHARYRRGDWRDWAAAQGRPDLAQACSLELPSSILAYRAAQEGLGVAMGQTALLSSEIEQGLLVRPFLRPLRRPMSYHLLTPKGRAPPLRVRAFRAWLRSELKGGL